MFLGIGIHCIFTSFKTSKINTPCSSKEAEHQVGGVQGVDLEGGEVRGQKNNTSTTMQRAGAGIGKYFLPVTMAAAARLGYDTSGGK